MQSQRPQHFAPNWFLGVPVDAAGWFEQHVTIPPDGFRRFHAADLHMTIAFLGAVAEEQARAAWGALRWPLGATRVSFGTVVPMGDARRYSALSIVLDTSREQVEQAISQCRDAACDAAKARRERRPAKAHVTIARPSRRAGDAERQAGLAWAQTLDLRGQTVTLDAVALYTWADDRRERQFKIVELRSAAG